MILSVALCTYNGERYIRGQIESILRQSMPVDEIIICDDGSTDNTLRIIESIQNRTSSNIRVYQSEKNLGVCDNFKKAVDLCKGDIVFFSDQDDLWHTDKVKIIAKYFTTHKNISVVFSNAILINKHGERIPKYRNLLEVTFPGFIRKMFYSGLELECFCGLDNYATGATMAARKTFLDETKPFSLCSKTILHDYAIALKAAEFDSLALIDIPLIDYRIHDKQQTNILSCPNNDISRISPHEHWPDPSKAELLTTKRGKDRIKQMSIRNKNMHRLLRIFNILFSCRKYIYLYKKKWIKVLLFDFSLPVRYCIHKKLLCGQPS